jgi:hypothetical protein
MDENHIRLLGGHLFRQASHLIQIASCEANIEPGIAPIQQIQPLELLFECDQRRLHLRVVLWGINQHANKSTAARLLRPGSKRPCSR